MREVSQGIQKRGVMRGRGWLHCGQCGPSCIPYMQLVGTRWQGGQGMAEDPEPQRPAAVNIPKHLFTMPSQHDYLQHVGQAENNPSR